MRRDGESASQMRTTVVHARDDSCSRSKSTSGGIIWPRVGLGHGACIQCLAIDAQSNAMVQIVLRKQHLGCGDAAVCTHCVQRDTLAGLNDQHITSGVELDAARTSQASSNLGGFPS